MEGRFDTIYKTELNWDYLYSTGLRTKMHWSKYRHCNIIYLIISVYLFVYPNLYYITDSNLKIWITAVLSDTRCFWHYLTQNDKRPPFFFHIYSQVRFRYWKHLDILRKRYVWKKIYLITLTMQNENWNFSFCHEDQTLPSLFKSALTLSLTPVIGISW